MALEIETLDNAFPSQKQAPRKKRPSRFAFAGKMALAAAALGGIWIFAATTTVSSFAPSHSALEKPQFDLMLSLRPAHAAKTSEPQAPEPLSLKINKFSRLYQQPAAPKAERLEGARLAAALAQRPGEQALADTLGAAFASATEEEKFQALAELRPEAEVVKQMLGEAMTQVVALAPRIEPAAGDALATITTASIPTEPAQDEALSDESAVELAAIEAEEAGRTAELAALMDNSLPMAGPLPGTRPQTAAKALEAMAVAKLSKPQADDAAEEPASTVLAYARPDNPVKPLAPVAPVPNPGTKKVAIYDITNGVVHMPNGTKLEAHSGIGKMRDNPKYTHVKMNGPTPPGTYKLSMREKLFHGVAAIRLTSVDGKHPQNRTGLLAHTYLLRSRPGDSHGCVAFKNYDKFLAAFRRGEITHMVIVPEYNGRLPGKNDNLLVKLFGGKGA
ncbi:MAG: DUF2778 domain-containing protein [Alphaproteobacteria bacterium]|nr:DUF2778 domain-containing protein [Alphaproteobacteria bacterium]MBU1550574.1 DUF2778 domain-containing protein [Alphaproteobacteria bacterium]MBU2338710.1 DUF2778 domain-containing protein [Alphaproteobacteria bacterium]MBU2386801.1 DUF2778 domain-containing protein [Alphaproteobacteria bacterium]